MIAEPTGSQDALAANAVFDVWVVIGPLIYLVQIPMATAWHRLILEPERTDGHRYMMGWNERLYFLKALQLMVLIVGLIILFGILVSVVAVPLQALTSNSPIFQMFVFTVAIVVLLYLAIGYFACPILLMLPAASIGKKLTSGEAYMAVREGRNNWALAIAYLIASAPIMIINWLATGVVEKLNLGNDFLRNFLYLAPEVLYAPALVGVLSITYRELVQKPEAAAGR
jgi:hypothetical protein